MMKLTCYGADGTDARVKLHHGHNKPNLEIAELFFSDLGEIDAFIAEIKAGRDNFAWVKDHLPDYMPDQPATDQ